MGVTDDDPSQLVAEFEDEHSRTELRCDEAGWRMLYLRRRVGGGWYIKESIDLPTSGAGKGVIRSG